MIARRSACCASLCTSLLMQYTLCAFPALHTALTSSAAFYTAVGSAFFFFFFSVDSSSLSFFCAARAASAAISWS